MTYLVIDNAERRVLAEFEVLDRALTFLEELRERARRRDVAVAWLADRPGEIVGTRSFVTMRVGQLEAQ